MKFSKKYCVSSEKSVAIAAGQVTSANLSRTSYLYLAALTAVSLCAPSAVGAANGLYKVIDASGKITYSDHLQTNSGSAKVIKVTRVNGVKGAKAGTAAAPGAAPGAAPSTAAAG